MGKKFNPAPGWPPTPEGWLPPDGWAPDPAWPPAPDGWQTIIDDEAGSTSQKLRGWSNKAAEAARKAKDVYDERQADKATVAAAAQPIAGPLFSGMSHEEGRNAAVTLYPDRIERVKQKSRMAISSAHQDVEVTPVRSVSSVQVKKQGLRSNVTVYASGNNIEFRFDHAQAQAFRNALTQLILATPTTTTSTPGPTPPSAPAPADPMEQLRKLGELHTAGVLSDEEFAAKKAKLLARM